MGKAQCGTCHFAPLFNGLIPPFYNLTEVEVLGTTKTDNLEKPEADTDLGRFNIFPISFYEKAFKTPTVRNVSATGPYMHNGAFKTLEAVVEFYNKGGGGRNGTWITHEQSNTFCCFIKPFKRRDKRYRSISSFPRRFSDNLRSWQQQTKANNKLK